MIIILLILNKIVTSKVITNNHLNKGNHNDMNDTNNDNDHVSRMVEVMDQKSK